MKIKVEPFLRRQGNQIAKAAIEFGPEAGPLEGFDLMGFTICEDEKEGLYVLFPASASKKPSGEKKIYFFLRPGSADSLVRLQNAILDVYEDMTGKLVTTKASQ